MDYNYCEKFNNYIASVEEEKKKEECGVNIRSGEHIVCTDEILMKYMVEVTEILLESIWRSSQITQPRLCPLNEYIIHVIRQSRISLYTLKCAIIYFVRMSRQLQDKKWRNKVRLFCGRRMFLGSVIIASKYLYDRTYSNSMWAKILSLDIKEVNNIQMDFLEALNFDLYISEELDTVWSQMLENFISYLKVRQEEVEEDLSSKENQNSILSSPKSSPRDFEHGDENATVPDVYNFSTSPLSPENSIRSFDGREEEDEEGKSESEGESNDNNNIKNNSINNDSRVPVVFKNTEESSIRSYYYSTHEMKEKKLEEYRPFVKVLIQVIFIYSKNVQLPIGEKRIIELPKLATNPDLLFVNSCGRPMDHYHPISGYSKLMSSYSLYRRRRHLYDNKLNNKVKLNFLRYNFSKLFPNHHLLMNSITSDTINTSGYYSDTTINHCSTFHRLSCNHHQKKVNQPFYDSEFKAQQAQKAYENKKLTLDDFYRDENDHKNYSEESIINTTNTNTTFSSVSSSNWESLYDEGLASVEFSDEESDCSSCYNFDRILLPSNNHYSENQKITPQTHFLSSKEYKKEKDLMMHYFDKDNYCYPSLPLQQQQQKQKKPLYYDQRVPLYRETSSYPFYNTLQQHSTTEKYNIPSNSSFSQSLSSLPYSMNKQIYHKRIIYQRVHC
ncbi:hypothetical protein U3516DRAFT_912929 [Neocallimastix sp. 'constans']|jgi:hypothetical protein